MKYIKIAAVAIFLIIVYKSCNNPLWKAHTYNEDGISHYSNNEFLDARIDYENSITYGIKSEIPTYNLANNYYKEKNFSSAHEYYEKALKINSDIPEIIFNDGHALYNWGLSELDKDFCNIERTIFLWQKACSRFDNVMKVTFAKSELHTKSKIDIDFIEKEISYINEMHKRNIEKCKAKQQNQKKPSQKNKDQDKKDNQKNKNNKDDKKNQQDEKNNQGGSLSKKENEEVDKALDRIKKDAGQFKFGQNKVQQLRKGKGRENVGSRVYK